MNTIPIHADVVDCLYDDLFAGSIRPTRENFAKTIGRFVDGALASEGNGFRNYADTNTILRDYVPAAARALRMLSECCHGVSVNAGWYTDLKTGEPLKVNVGEKLMLVVSEVAEAMEGHRKNKLDDHLPSRSSIEVELADAIIRICDLGGYLKLDLGGAVLEKMNYNAVRIDHKVETRLAPGGKAY